MTCGEVGTNHRWYYQAVFAGEAIQARKGRRIARRAFSRTVTKLSQQS